MSGLNQVPNLDALVKKYGLTTFVETGCGNGNGLRYAAELGLEQRVSCDLREEAAMACKDLGMIHICDSLKFLRSVAHWNEAPTLWWLDAHFPEHYGHDAPDLKWPLFDELKILAGKKGIERDVVVCDDMHVINAPDNPTFHPWLPDYFKVKDQTIAQLCSVLPLKSTLYDIDTGILVLEPK